MKHLVLVSSVLVGAVGSATAGPKAKTPPVPAYWIGEFALPDNDPPEPGTVQDGFVTVKAADAPEDGIIVQPLDPAFVARPSVGLGDTNRIYKTQSYTPPLDERPSTAPVVIVVAKATNPTPAVIKNKKVEKAIRKRIVKDYPAMKAEAKSWPLGIADLDADGVGDVAILFGCHEWEGGCSTEESMVYERNGAGWKEIKLASDDQ
jgi:hypothetical protein